MSDASLTDDIRRFFEAFGRAGNALDLDVLEGCFAEVFMAADPGGTQAVPRRGFLQVLPRRAEQFAAAGVTGTTLREVNHQVLDETYVLVHTEWTTEGSSADGRTKPVTLLSTFIVRREPAGLRIVFYLNHQDLAAVLAPTSHTDSAH
jgi:ketosteroid isomerase-like protein